MKYFIDDKEVNKQEFNIFVNKEIERLVRIVKIIIDTIQTDKFRVALFKVFNEMLIKEKSIEFGNSKLRIEEN